MHLGLKLIFLHLGPQQMKCVSSDRISCKRFHIYFFYGSGLTLRDTPESYSMNYMALSFGKAFHHSSDPRIYEAKTATGFPSRWAMLPLTVDGIILQ